MFKKRGVPTNYAGFFAKQRLWIAVCTLIGTIIGAGILGMPYAIAKVGLLPGLFLIILIGVSFIFLNLFLGEVILRTKGQHQLTGYAEKYLGPWGKKLMTFSMLVSIYGALSAYLIGIGTALQAIFKTSSAIPFIILFFLFGFLIVYRGIKATGKAELLLVSFLIVVIIAIGWLSLDNLNPANFSGYDLAKFLLPYGVVVFAFVGSAALPEIQEELGKEKKKMKKAIIIGSVIPIVVYILFTIVMMGLIGIEQFELLEPNQRIATVALSIYSTPLFGLFANILAVLTMTTSFFALGLALLEMYQFDYGVSRNPALLLTFIFPLLVAVFKLTTFIAILGITGVFSGGLDGILVVLMYWKAKLLGERKPEYSLPLLRPVGIFLIVMFALGILYQLLALVT
ncbi:MAG: aromatic amino acid transport family protein [Nanoarchaeota archaeon]